MTEESAKSAAEGEGQEGAESDVDEIEDEVTKLRAEIEKDAKRCVTSTNCRAIRLETAYGILWRPP